jgi:hypothetical protein
MARRYQPPRCKAKQLTDGKRCTNRATKDGYCRIRSHQEQGLSRAKSGTGQRARGRAKLTTRKKRRRRKVSAKTRAHQIAFLEAYGRLGTITAAATEVGISRSRHGEWINDPVRHPDYEAAFEEADEIACDNIVDEIRRRGVDGVEKPIFGRAAGKNAGTKIVGHVQEYSDRLLELLAKAKMPHLFRERVSAELTGKDGKPLGGGVDLSLLSSETLDRIEKELLEASEE